MISANIDKAKRRAVYRREWYSCAICDDTRHLQIHHVVHRSQGGTNHMMNLICLCPKCHALAHGTNLFDSDEFTQEDMEQAITEYMADFYAPNWNPWKKSAGDKEEEIC